MSRRCAERSARSGSRMFLHEVNLDLLIGPSLKAESRDLAEPEAERLKNAFEPASLETISLAK